MTKFSREGSHLQLGMADMREDQDASVRQVRTLIRAYVMMSPGEFSKHFENFFASSLSRSIIHAIIKREGHKLKGEFKKGKNLENFLELLPS